MIFATAKEVREDDERRFNHGSYWTADDLRKAKAAVEAGKPALVIAKGLGRQLSGLCIKLEKEGVLRKEYNQAECGSDYLYANVPTWAIPVPSTFADYCRNTTNPCAKIQLPTESKDMTVITKQTIIFNEVIETSTPDQLIYLLGKIKVKTTAITDIDAPSNAYVVKQLAELSEAKTAVLAELDKRA